MHSESAISQEYVFQDFIARFNIDDKSVLEVGGVLQPDLIKNQNVNWISVDPLYTPTQDYNLITSQKLSKINHVKRSINDCNFQENEFDFIFSCNAFQHISDLKGAFNNFFKWLKKGGVLYSHFGPIWSAPDGAHIEGMKYNGKFYNFWEFKLIPSWSHLYFDYKKMLVFLNKHYDMGFSTHIANHVFHSKWINRLSFSDYSKLLTFNPWGKAKLTYSQGIDYMPTNLLSGSEEGLEREIFDKLASNNTENFLARDLLIILEK